MHNNYYFLSQLSRELQHSLAGFTLVSSFSQHKNELILEFNDARQSFFISASLQPDFCCLSFPEDFARARKNSVDLFPAIILKKVKGVRQYENERSFSISLEGGFDLLFKMHGNRANIILFEALKPIQIFRNHLKADWELDLDALDRTIDWRESFFEVHQTSLRKDYFTFGKEVWTYVNGQGFEEAAVGVRWVILQQTLQKLKVPEYFICEDRRLSLTLLPTGTIVAKFSDPIEAINEFYHQATHTNTFLKEKNSALQLLHKRQENGQQYIQKNTFKLHELSHDSHYHAWADLIMANLDKIKAGADKITVPDFYHQDQPIEIKLNKTLNGQRNAEVYYRKGKNQLIEIKKLKESIAAKEAELEAISKKITAVENETALKVLRKTIEETGVLRDNKEKQKITLPYHEFEYHGFRIWVGKNAASNDLLTLKHTFKDDLWLHAKDVAGSHVVIKYQSGKNFPKDVIEHAAGLAAYHSKRKNESLCPVIVTPKKFVRKRKGDPAGAVVLEREEVVLVPPLKKH